MFVVKYRSYICTVPNIKYNIYTPRNSWHILPMLDLINVSALYPWCCIKPALYHSSRIKPLAKSTDHSTYTYKWSMAMPYIIETRNN